MQPNPTHRPRTAVLTIAEVMDVLRIGRTKAYEQDRLYLDTNGEDGLPCVKVGDSIRFLRHATEDLIGEPITTDTNPHDTDPPRTTTQPNPAHQRETGACRRSGVDMMHVRTVFAGSARAAAEYSDKYLAKDSCEIPGRWTGRQAPAFDLVGDVTVDALSDALAGLDPVTGKPLGRPLRKRLTRSRPTSRPGLVPGIASVAFDTSLHLHHCNRALHRPTKVELAISCEGLLAQYCYQIAPRVGGHVSRTGKQLSGKHKDHLVNAAQPRHRILYIRQRSRVVTTCSNTHFVDQSR
jgi:hypothetical protein